jgi:hypothetical protein
MTRRRSLAIRSSLLAIPVLAASIVLVLALGVADAAAPSSQAIAAAINLKPSDMPGFKASGSSSSSSSSASNDPVESRMARCGVAMSHPREVSADSPDFKKSSGVDFEQVSSHVGLERSPGTVATDLEAVRSSRVLNCFDKVLDGAQVGASIGSQTMHMIDVHASSLAYTVRGSDDAVDLRISLAYNPPGPVLTVFLDFRTIATGHDEVMLTTVRTFQPFPAAKANRLVALLLRRALARPH